MAKDIVILSDTIFDEKRQRNYQKCTVDGGEGKKWDNGQITNLATGVLMVNPLANKITTENHKEMMAARRQKYEAAVRQGIAEGTRSPNSMVAVKTIMAARAKVAVEDGSRAGNDAARLVLQMLNLIPKDEKES